MKAVQRMLGHASGAGNHDRMLSTYLNAVMRSGFTPEEVDEPTAGPRLARRQRLDTAVPIFFTGRASRRR